MIFHQLSVMIALNEFTKMKGRFLKTNRKLSLKTLTKKKRQSNILTA